MVDPVDRILFHVLKDQMITNKLNEIPATTYHKKRVDSIWQKVLNRLFLRKISNPINLLAN